MTQTKCRECGCPHTTIHEHVVLNERFFLTERHCDNCDNIWTSLENQSPFREAEQTKKPTKKLEFSISPSLSTKYSSLRAQPIP